MMCQDDGCLSKTEYDLQESVESNQIVGDGGGIHPEIETQK